MNKFAELFDKEVAEAKAAFRKAMTNYSDDIIRTTDLAYNQAKRLEILKRERWFSRNYITHPQTQER